MVRAGCQKQRDPALDFVFSDGSAGRERGVGTFEDRHYDDAPFVLGDTSLADLLSRASKLHDVAFIDATGVLRAHRDEKLYHRWDTHPTARAYELVGGEVEDRFSMVLER